MLRFRLLRKIAVAMTALSAWIFVIMMTAPASVAETRAADNDEKLNLEQAREYMLTLINKHRETQKLRPVVLDPVATKAGQEHSDEMATKGYLGHLDIAGRKPWERYTLAGGTGYVSENTYKSYEGGNGTGNFSLDSEPRFTKAEIEDAENELFFEKPPNDGHRRNILDPNHDGVGVGISRGLAGDNNCLTVTQEFTEIKGTFAPIPRTIDGAPISVKGRLLPGYKFDYLSVEYDPLPKPMTPQELDKIPSYDIPQKTIKTAWPPPFDSELPVSMECVDGCDDFTVTVTPEAKWPKGIYYAEVWIKDKNGQQFPVSSRTLRKE